MAGSDNYCQKVSSLHDETEDRAKGAVLILLCFLAPICLKVAHLAAHMLLKIHAATLDMS